MSPARLSADALRRAQFERAFVATTYLLGQRGGLTSALRDPGVAAESVQRDLAAPLREQRASVLASELARIVAALEARRVRLR